MQRQKLTRKINASCFYDAYRLEGAANNCHVYHICVHLNAYCSNYEINYYMYIDASKYDDVHSYHRGMRNTQVNPYDNRQALPKRFSSPQSLTH